MELFPFFDFFNRVLSRRMIRGRCALLYEEIVKTNALKIIIIEEYKRIL